MATAPTIDLSKYAGQTFYGPHPCVCKRLIVRQALEFGGQKFDALATEAEYDGNYPSNRPDLPWQFHVCPADEQSAPAAHDDDLDCFTKARARGQQTFTVVAQDRSSPRTICFWIMENIETCPAEKLIDALKDALAMREHPNRKAAD